MIWQEGVGIGLCSAQIPCRSGTVGKESAETEL